MNHADFIGKQIIQNGDKGIIKYSGNLRHAVNNPRVKVDDHWVGIQWHSIQRGNHNGNVKGVQYFKCDSNTSGSLLKLSKVNQGSDILKAYIKKYFKEEDVKKLLENENEENLIDSLNQIRKNMEQMKLEKQNIEYDEQAWIKTSISYKKIEFLGFDRIWKILKNSHLIKHLSLEKLNISHLGKQGQVRELFKAVEELSLLDNLFNSWDIINQLIAEFPKLKNLQLGQNTLKFEEEFNKDKKEFCENFNYEFIPLQKFQFNNYFEQLEVLALAKLNLNFEVLNRVKYAFKNIKELILSHNKCNDFQNLQINNDEFKDLEILDLTNNLIDNLNSMTSWNNFKLKKLNLQNNNIQRLHYSPVLQKLTHLNIMDNQISTKDILFDLAQFPQLKSIKYLNNPICQFYDKIVLKCFMISAIPKLEQINGSKLKYRERDDSEIFYLRNTFHEFFKEQGVDKYTYDYNSYQQWVKEQYPQTDNLLRTYGNPYPVEERFYEELQTNKNLEQFYQQGQIAMGKGYSLLKVIKMIEGEEYIIIQQKIPKSTTISLLKKYISHVMNTDIDKIELRNKDDDKCFENLIKKVEDYEDEKQISIKIIELNQQNQLLYGNSKRSLESCRLFSYCTRSLNRFWMYLEISIFII